MAIDALHIWREMEVRLAPQCLFEGEPLRSDAHGLEPLRMLFKRVRVVSCAGPSERARERKPPRPTQLLCLPAPSLHAEHAQLQVGRDSWGACVYPREACGRGTAAGLAAVDKRHIRPAADQRHRHVYSDDPGTYHGDAHQLPAYSAAYRAQ